MGTFAYPLLHVINIKVNDMNTIRQAFIVLTLLILVSVGLNIPAAEASAPNPVVIMETSMGRVIVMLYPKKAPKTVENFLKYVDAGFYDKTIFHRIVRMEMQDVVDGRKQQSYNIVQGGGFNYPMKQKRPLWEPIVNEDRTSLQNTKGTIAMARRGHPDSATSQFFFNLTNNTSLNPMVINKKKWAGLKQDEDEGKELRHGYCAFGKVIRGWDVVEKIHQVPTATYGKYKNVPKSPIFIKKMYRAK